MSGSQKFIARNRAPRVQIEYDVELYGAQKKVQLPFVMGVMSDLSGKSEQPPVADRKFLEIDVDNFDERMRAIAPRASFSVPNTLTGEGNLAVDLTFEKMEDFSPQAIAARVESLAPLLEARRQLSDLMAYMDGKSRAETLIETLLSDPDLLTALAGVATGDAGDMDAALATLKARMPDPEPEDDGTDRTLANLAARAPQEAPSGPTADDVLAGVERRAERAEPDRASEVLAGIERREDVLEENRTSEVLSAIERRERPEAADRTADVLAGIERQDDATEPDTTADEALASVERREERAAPDDTADVLAGIERRDQEADTRPKAEDVLAGIDRRDEGAAAEDDGTDDILSNIERREETAETDSTDDILAGLEPAEAEADTSDDLDDLLADLDMADEAAELSDASEEPLPSEAPEHAPADDLGIGEEGTDSHADDGYGDLSQGSLVDEKPDGASGTSSDDLDALLADLDADDDAGGSETEAEATVDADPLDVAEEALQDARQPGIATGMQSGADLSADSDPSADDLDDLLADLDAADEPDAGTGAGPVRAAVDDAGAEDLDDLLADLGTDDDAAETAPDQPDAAEAQDAVEDDLDALLADLGRGDDATEEAQDRSEAAEAEDAGAEDLDDLLADLDVADEPEATEAEDAAENDLDALLADPGVEDASATVPDAGSDLDDLLADLDAGQADDAASEPGGLDDLLDEIGATEPGEAGKDDLDALLDDLTTADAGEAGEGAEDDLDALLADMETTEVGTETAMEEVAEAPAPAPETRVASPAQTPFGTISAPKPERESMNRNRFRMALFGDFTGRAARGLMETGDALAARKAIPLDVDTVEDVIEGFATTLTLPIGKDGAGIEVKLGGLDDLHPDELYESVEIFEAISGLRQQLGVGSMAGKVTDQLKAWAEEFGTPVRLPKRSAATSVPPDLKLSDFQALIGDTRGTLTRPTPADDLIARIVGPHVVKGPDAGAAEMLEAVDEALSAAMRLVLHHPDFQAVESQWRSLDLLARRIETDTDLQIVLYDVSAEELAADLAAGEDLSQSGLYRLLTDVMDPEDGDGGFSALFGLYTFEETPPHAELLARIGHVAAHVDAPFFAAISPAFLVTPKEERHKLVADAWDTLRAQPQATHLGLASPRFMLRQPYGSKSDPCYEFDFEEFTPKEGLKGLLWANPVVLVAILLAAAWKKDGRAMSLGSLMSLGDIPFTYVTDRHGDQVALPCTERNISSDAAQATLGRGYMPVVWVKGRNEIRLGSFRSLGGAEIAGPWSDAAPARPSPPQATLEMDIAAGPAPEGRDGATDDQLAEPDGLLDSGDNAEPDDALDLLGSEDDDDQSLDDLLASFADDDDAAADDDDMDPELAALLEGL